MYWELYQLLVAFAGACTLAVFLIRRSIVPLSFIASGLWSILALQARTIEVYHQDGSLTVVESRAWQFVALGLGLLMIGVIALFYWGHFPVEDPEPESDLAATSDSHSQSNVR